MAGSGVGKSVLIDMIARGSSADIVVVGLIGERAREVSDFVERHMNAEKKDKTIVVAVPADHAPNLRLRGALLATSMAEHFRAPGKKVLLIMDSLTRVAHAPREIGLLLGEPRAARGYPPSALHALTQTGPPTGPPSATGTPRRRTRPLLSPSLPIMPRTCACAVRCSRPRWPSTSARRARRSCSSWTASPAWPTPRAKSACCWANPARRAAIRLRRSPRSPNWSNARVTRQPPAAR